MKSLIRVGAYNSKLAVARAKRGIRLLERKRGEASYELIIIHGIDSSNESEEIEKLSEALIAGDIDIAVSEVRIIKRYAADEISMSAIVGRGDSRNVVISNKEVKEYENGAIVEVKSVSDALQAEKIYENIDIQEETSDIYPLFGRIKNKECHAGVFSADAVKLLKMHNLRTLSYAYLDCRQMVPRSGQAMIGIMTIKGSPLARFVRKKSDSVAIKEYKLEKQITDRFAESEGILKDSLAVSVLINRNNVNIDLYARIDNMGMKHHYRDSQRGLYENIELYKRRIIDNLEKELSY